MIEFGDNVNMVLAHKLRLLDPYLKLKANELIFNKPCELDIDYGDKWEKITGEEMRKFDYDFLNDFVTQLATIRRQKFNEKNPALSCELPSPYNRYRVQAQHKSSLFNSDIVVDIRIPSQTRFELENFELSQKIQNFGWTYAKIRALIRNKKNVLISGGTGSGKTSFLNSLLGEIDENQRFVYFRNEVIDLTTKEYELLMLFVKNRGTAFTREDILQKVWEENYFGSDRVVDDTMRRLRRKMPNLTIHTIYGFGYRLG